MQKDRANNLITQLVIREQGNHTDTEQPRVQPYAPSYLDYLDGSREDVPEDKPERGILIIPVL